MFGYSYIIDLRNSYERQIAVLNNAHDQEVVNLNHEVSYLKKEVNTLNSMTGFPLGLNGLADYPIRSNYCPNCGHKMEP